MDKSELRQRLRLLNRTLSPRQRAIASAEIFRQIEASSAFAEARCVALFCSLADEPDTGGVLQRWRMAGKRIVVPRVEGAEMQFYDYLPDEVVRGAFGIVEPTSEARLCLPSEIDLMVVPGVAFTREGMRLGRGKGFYDKYLAQRDFCAYSIGVGYAHQLMENLPTEPHDRRLDEVVCL